MCWLSPGKHRWGIQEIGTLGVFAEGNDADRPPGHATRQPPLPGLGEQGCRGPLGREACSETTRQAVSEGWGCSGEQVEREDPLKQHPWGGQGRSCWNR